MAKSIKKPESKAEEVKQKHAGGRPTKYSTELAERICETVATSTDGLRKICRLHDGFPSHETVYQWRNKYSEFSDQYANAKRLQAELLAEEIIDIADDDSRDYIDTEEGLKFNSEHVQRSRLRIDSRKWIACKLLPKIYGDKTVTESTVTIKHEDALKELK